MSAERLTHKRGDCEAFSWYSMAGECKCTPSHKKLSVNWAAKAQWVSGWWGQLVCHISWKRLHLHGRLQSPATFYFEMIWSHPVSRGQFLKRQEQKHPSLKINQLLWKGLAFSCQVPATGRENSLSGVGFQPQGSSYLIQSRHIKKKPEQTQLKPQSLHWKCVLTSEGRQEKRRED